MVSGDHGWTYDSKSHSARNVETSEVLSLTNNTKLFDEEYLIEEINGNNIAIDIKFAELKDLVFTHKLKNKD